MAATGVSKFTKFPKMWREQLMRVRATGCTYRVALYLLDRTNFSKQVILSTTAMRRLGVSRNGKRGALNQLRRAGLIAVEERADKNPIVTVRWVD
jgi:hypothetical protein